MKNLTPKEAQLLQTSLPPVERHWVIPGSLSGPVYDESKGREQHTKTEGHRGRSQGQGAEVGWEAGTGAPVERPRRGGEVHGMDQKKRSEGAGGASQGSRAQLRSRSKQVLIAQALRPQRGSLGSHHSIGGGSYTVFRFACKKCR